jgi:hypothetical protein
MEDDCYMGRGYLLPKGCKDLFDALKLKVNLPAGHPGLPPARLSPALMELEVPEQLSVEQLAGLLGEEPAQIVFDLMKLGIYVKFDEELDFETISLVIRQYGFDAKKLA